MLALQVPLRLSHVIALCCYSKIALQRQARLLRLALLQLRLLMAL